MNELRDCFSAEEKRLYLQALIYIFSSGKKLTKENEDYLRHLAEEISVDAAELKTLKKFKKPEEAGKLIKSIKDIRIRRFILREMVLLAVADHEISDCEMVDIYRIANEAGIKEEKINDFFLWAAEGIEWQMQGRRLITEDL